MELLKNLNINKTIAAYTTDPSVKPLRELAYLPKGVMDPHEIPASDTRVGKLPEEVYDWMRPESNENKDKVSNPNN